LASHHLERRYIIGPRRTDRSVGVCAQTAV
jgi:hypothetical protein